MKKLIVLLLCSALVSSVFAKSIFDPANLAQEDASENNPFVVYDRGVGIAFVGGENTIPGLQYQQWVTDTFGYAVTFGANYNNTYHSGDADLFGQLQWALYTAENSVLSTRLYSWLTAGTYIRKLENWEHTTPNLFMNGLGAGGFGFEMVYLKHLSVPLEFGYRIEGPTEFTIGLTGNVALRYRY